MKHSDGYFLRKVGDVVYLQNFDAKDRVMIFLNETGAFMWQKMEDCITVDDLVKAVVNEYEVEEKTAAKDIKEFLEFLADHGCIVREGNV